MEQQIAQPIIEAPTEISEGFWTMKGHYFGKTLFMPDRISFNGHRRNFTLKKIPLTFDIALNTIRSIHFSNSRLIKIVLNDGKERILMLGQGEINEYGSASAANMLSSAVARGAGDSLYQIARSKNNEKLLQDIYETLKGTPMYSPLIAEAPTGVKTSTLHKSYILVRLLYGVLLLAFFAFLAARKLRS